MLAFLHRGENINVYSVVNRDREQEVEIRNLFRSLDCLLCASASNFIVEAFAKQGVITFFPSRRNETAACKCLTSWIIVYSQ